MSGARQLSPALVASVINIRLRHKRRNLLQGKNVKGLDGPGELLSEGEGLGAGVDDERFIYRLLQGNS